MMRLQTFFALLLIVHVCSAQNGLLNQINTQTKEVETCKTEVETCKTEVKTLKTSCLDNFRCPTEKSGYRILEDRCYFFESVNRGYSATQEYCKTAFGPYVVGKLWEPKSLKINNVVVAEAKNIFGTSVAGIWIGISNDGKFRYQSSGETATWDMPYYSEHQKTGNIGTRHCLFYNLNYSNWRTNASCTGSPWVIYTVCEIDD